MTTTVVDTPATTLTEEEARQLDAALRAASGSIWRWLLPAHEGQIWRRFGIETFEAYVQTRMKFSTQRAYQLIHQGKVNRAIAGVMAEWLTTPVDVDLAERVTRKLTRKILPQLLEEIRSALASAPEGRRTEVAAEILKVLEAEDKPFKPETVQVSFKARKRRPDCSCPHLASCEAGLGGDTGADQ